MTSASAQRPTAAMTTAARSSSRFTSNFAGMANGNEKSSQAIGSSFPSSNWQSNTIWGNTGISRPRDAVGANSKASENTIGSQPSSGSAQLSIASEADPWGSRAPGPWGISDSSTRQGSGSTSPTTTRQDSGYYPVAQSHMPSTIGPPRLGTISRPKTGQGRDSSASSLNYPSFDFDEKENSPFAPMRSENEQMAAATHANKRVAQEPAHLGLGGIGRESSMPQHGASERDGLSHGSTYQDVYGTYATSTLHAQRPSLGGPSVSLSAHANRQAFQHNQSAAMDDESLLHERVARSLVLSDSTNVSNGLAQVNTFGGAASQSFQFNPASQPWDNAQTVGAFQDTLSGPFARRPSVANIQNSPAGSYRAVNSPRSYSGTPQPAIEQWSRPSSRDPRMGNELDRRGQHYLAQQIPQYFAAPGFYAPTYSQYAPSPYETYLPNYRQLVPIAGGYGPPMGQYIAGTAGLPPLRQNKETDPAKAVRSVLLEEFRSNSRSNKRYELKDIYNHIVEFSGDQHGSRFIQTKLETANSDEKEQVFREIEPNAMQLMKDVFGNYVIQKFFEHGNQVQKKVLAGVMKGKVMDLSIQMYACRAVQKALEHVLVDQQAELIKELEPDILKAVKDQNGNHVVQKIIELVPRQYIGFIMDCFRGRVSELAAHTYGCRVVQRVLEYGTDDDKKAIMEELHVCAQLLITDQYGNYVIQHVIQHGKPEDRSKMISIVINQLVTLSKHKFASNVVEKCIEHGTPEERKRILDGLTAMGTDGGSILQLIMKDQYGNYVIQKLLNQLEGPDRDAFIEQMRPQFLSLKKGSSNGRQINAIDRLMFAASSSASGTKNGTPTSTAPASPALPVDLSSAAPTPNLTTESNSPSSSSPPSTGASAVEEALDVSQKPAVPNGEGAAAACPEVRVDEA